MRVFLVGGTGYIGRAVTREFLARGHEPVVLARSAASEEKLPDEGVTFVRGDLSDSALLREQAAVADAVVYLAVAGLQGATEDDLAAVPLLLNELAGSGRPFVLTSGLGVYSGMDRPVVSTEDPLTGVSPAQQWRADLEATVLAGASQGVRSVVVRPAIVYGGGSASGLLTGYLTHVAEGNAPFMLGGGGNQIPTVHVDDLARAYADAVEAAPAGTVLDVVGGSVLGYDLARAVGAAAGSSLEPEQYDIGQARDALGFAGVALGLDLNVSVWPLASLLDWSAREPSLLLELKRGLIPAPRPAE
jgi:nucleoside-diphosphate-sugar epimerase